MQDQHQREEKSVRIFMGLLLCAFVTVLGLALLWVADEVLGVGDGLADGLRGVIQVGAVVAAIVYVHRHRRS